MCAPQTNQGVEGDADPEAIDHDEGIGFDQKSIDQQEERSDEIEAEVGGRLAVYPFGGIEEESSEEQGGAEPAGDIDEEIHRRW